MFTKKEIPKKENFPEMHAQIGVIWIHFNIFFSFFVCFTQHCENFTQIRTRLILPSYRTYTYHKISHFLRDFSYFTATLPKPELELPNVKNKNIFYFYDKHQFPLYLEALKILYYYILF